jgi:hypothetical protein
MAVPRSVPPGPAPGKAADHVPIEPPPARSYHCDNCGRLYPGEPGGAGLFIWTRGDEVRYEEPPLCDRCAYEINIGALMRWSVEEEEEG